MTTDPIVEEIREIRERLAMRFQFDVQRIAAHARQLDLLDSRKVVRRARREPSPSAALTMARK